MSASSDLPQIDVLGLGSVAYDDLLYVDAYPPPNRKTRVLRKFERFGGLTGGALIAAARLGARCAYAGRLGFDPASLAVDAAFAREGIDTRHAARDPANGVGRSTIIVSTPEATRNVFSQHTGKTGAHEQLPEESVIRSARVLLVDHHGVDGAIRAARLVREAGNSVVGDFERDDPPRLDELLALVDHLILPEDFAHRLTGRSTAERAVTHLRKSDSQTIVVTAGDRGCWYMEAGGSEAHHCRALRVKAFDTTGCGDVFHGAYAAALAGGMELGERLQFATAAAAFKAAAALGEDGVPQKADIEEFLRERR